MILVDGIRRGWCHMVSDGDEAELHAFARRLRLRHTWFQGSPRPHYDLTLAKRARAIGLGAAPVTAREFVAQIGVNQGAGLPQWYCYTCCIGPLGALGHAICPGCNRPMEPYRG